MPVTAPTLGVRFDDAALEASVRTGLDAVEVTLADAVRSDDEFVDGAAGYLVAAGGKRFRPLVTVLAAKYLAMPRVATAIHAQSTPDSPEATRSGRPIARNLTQSHLKVDSVSQSRSPSQRRSQARRERLAL